MTRLRRIPWAVLGIAICLSLALPSFAQEQPQPQPNPEPAPAPQPVKVKITAISGTVQYRATPESEWKKVEVGMELESGADLRTGVRSAVAVFIPPQQTITLDRLGTVRILQVLQDPQKVTADLGMKYGRTRVRLETGGRENVTTVSTPGATLAVRGSDATIHHDPLYTYAVGDGHLTFIDPTEQTELEFGGDGVDAAVDNENPSAGFLERGLATVDPKGGFPARDELGQLLVEERPGTGGEDYSERAAFAGGIFPIGGVTREGKGDQAQGFNSLFFDFRFLDGIDNVSTVNFSVTDPGGFTMNFANPMTPDGRGTLTGNGVQQNGLGEVFAVYGKQGMDYVPGSYTINAALVPDNMTNEVGVFLDGFRVVQGADVTVLNFNPVPPARIGFLQPGADRFTTSVIVP